MKQNLEKLLSQQQYHFSPFFAEKLLKRLENETYLEQEGYLISVLIYRYFPQVATLGIAAIGLLVMDMFGFDLAMSWDKFMGLAELTIEEAGNLAESLGK
jgi:hypothetical protein